MTAELDAARALLAEVQTWHEARARACDRAVSPFDGTVATFLDRADWMYEHPVADFECWRMDEILAEVHPVDRTSLSVPAVVHLPPRPVISEDRQLAIAMAALEHQQPAFTRGFIGRTA